MPKDTIASTFVDNGPDDQHTNVLQVSWGAKGGAPETPNGWVNAGYAHLGITKERDAGESMIRELDACYVELDAPAMDHLIRTLKRIRRRTFDA